MTEPLPPILDHAYLRGLYSRESSPHFLSHLFHLFLQHMPEILLQVHSCIHQGKDQDLIKHVHRLKGSASCVGATHMSTLCERFESGSLALSDFIPQLESSSLQTYEAVHAMLCKEKT